MKKMCLFFLTTCVILSFLMLASTTEAFDLDRYVYYDVEPYDEWVGLEFIGRNVLIGAKGNVLYKITINRDLSLSWIYQPVTHPIVDMDVPDDHQIYVAYVNTEGTLVTRYTSNLGSRDTIPPREVAWGAGGGCFRQFMRIPVDHIAITDNGEYLAGMGLGYLFIWDVDDPSEEWVATVEMNVDTSNYPTDIEASGGSWIFAANRNLSKQWRANTGGYLGAVDSTMPVYSLDFEEYRLASGCRGRVHIWEVSGHQERSFITTKYLPSSDATYKLDAVEFSKDTNHLAAISASAQKLYVWSGGSQPIETHSVDEIPTALAISPDKNFIMVGSNAGRLYLFDNLSVAGAPAAETEAPANPEQTILLANYPNPFNPETWIPYQLATPAEVTVSIHAADGTLVRRLALGQLPAGVYQDKDSAAYWDGKNEQGEAVASGVYFYTLKAGDFSATKKMLIRK